MALQFVLQLISLMLWLTKASAEVENRSCPGGCLSKCGNVSIPYPFGIKKFYYMNEWFEVTCNDSFKTPKPFLKALDLEIIEIFLKGQVLVNSPVISTCMDSEKEVRGRPRIINLTGSPFSFSKVRNIFTAMGCDNLALITERNHVVGGCMSMCTNGLSTTRSGCFGNNCCQTPITLSPQIFNVTFNNIGGNSSEGDCKFGFLVDKDWFTSHSSNSSKIKQMGYVPVVLDWGIIGACDGNWYHNCGPNTYCKNLKTVQNCYCREGFEGNPYDNYDGCKDINECEDPNHNSCTMTGMQCTNTPGSYTCHCPSGFHDDEARSMESCHRRIEESIAKMVALGVGLGLGLLLVLLLSLRSYQLLKKRRKRKIREKFFKRNGGLLLQQQVSSEEGSVERTKIFTAKELQKATDNFNENQILGQGGQGTVYKGMLVDGMIVAIKKSKIVDEGQIEQFINEVVMLSQINHRNVVKLLGCCLETEVSLLVYEFISKGTLFHYIHDQSEEFPNSWDNRLKIATDVATALAYLHSAASMPIYHRDIKSSNILLDDKYIAKISDFGISRSIPTDKTHLTTLVQGTLGYLDPEYYQSSQFTEKSDVYSFGVVLVELLTGEKPISFTRAEDERNLASHLLSSIRENRLFEILDAQVVKEARKEELETVAHLAKRCLSLNGRKRPTMKEVAMNLEGLRMSKEHFLLQQTSEEECFTTDRSSLFDVGSVSTEYPSLGKSEISSLDVKPVSSNESTSFPVHTI